MDGVFGGPAAPFSTVAAAHLGSLAEHTGGCFPGWGEGARWFLEGLRGFWCLGGLGDVTFMSRQTPGLWVGLGV